MLSVTYGIVATSDKSHLNFIRLIYFTWNYIQITYKIILYVISEGVIYRTLKEYRELNTIVWLKQLGP